MPIEYLNLPVLPTVKAHLIINCVLVFLTLVVVALRIIARFESGVKLWWDDFLILLAVPQGIGMLVIQGMWAPMGVGYPATETLPNLVPILKMLVAYEFIFATCISTIKMSVMFFYLRVFVNDGLRLATKLVIGFVLLWSVGNILQVFLICRPFAATYDPTIKGKCGSQVVSFIAIGAFNVITDAIILTLPIPTIWGLKMSSSARLGLSAVFMIGLIVSVVAIIRIISLTQLDLTNLTGTMVWADFWSTVEPNLGIICVSLPMLSRLRSRFTSRRGASKLEGPSSECTGSYRRGNAATGRLGPTMPTDHRHDEAFGLETLYGSNKQVHHASIVASGTKPPAEAPSRDGSEEALTLQPANPGQDKNGILVQTKWTITSN
ncbi:hypothetical protein CONLIGDRAFT_713264 [Coniochaeta ligniaria NRRL 30616]|uniref:Rhodopsin domain-containing protein n=1 Tax=Coniochaeta ligniaria NRRL 30616 TaxID=1408157 RepID=A0A1J7ISR6_9PEZI|nr:hypothetical protein CONLIGDRAFT_713264 [Coniochaeta ligniaria NRRL 30616]